jgi:hypothetical protein
MKTNKNCPRYHEFHPGGPPKRQPKGQKVLTASAGASSAPLLAAMPPAPVPGADAFAAPVPSIGDVPSVVPSMGSPAF